MIFYFHMETTSAANIYRDSVIQSFIKITVSAYGCNTATNKKVTLVQSGEGAKKRHQSLSLW